MGETLRIALGVIITLLLVGIVTPVLVKLAEKRARAMFNEPERPNAGPSPVGFLEGLIFYGSFYVGNPGGLVLASAWLVFKTAAKWKTWESIEKLPNGNPNNTPGEISARYEAFLTGTSANIVAAMIGAVTTAALGAVLTT